MSQDLHLKNVVEEKLNDCMLHDGALKLGLHHQSLVKIPKHRESIDSLMLWARVRMAMYSECRYLPMLCPES